jgi:hypothetical protein
MGKLTGSTLRYDTITDMVRECVTVDPDGTCYVDEEKAKTLWYYGVTNKIVENRLFIKEIPSSNTYNEYKAWNYALYQYYARHEMGKFRHLSPSFSDVLFECVAVADNIREKITNLTLFEREWKRWKNEHEDFIVRIGIGTFDAYCATLAAFNAHLARTLKNDPDNQEVTGD